MSDLNSIVFLLVGLVAGVGIAIAALWLPMRGRLRASELLVESLQQSLIASEKVSAKERDRALQLASDAARLPDALERVKGVEDELTVLRERLRNAGGSEAAALATANAKQEDADRLASALKDANGLLEVARKDIEKKSAEQAKAIAECEAAKVIAEDSRAFLKSAQEQLRTAFTEAASAVFDQKATLLDKGIEASAVKSKEGLAETLKPFAEQVTKFQEKIERLASDDATQRATLVGTISELKTLNQTMADATNAMTKALKGNAKARGDWGEMILETVLKASGLEEGIHFVSQATSLDDETGRQQRPDVIVTLPDGRQIVVDSKVNLVAWAEANQADSLEVQQEALIRHAAAMRLHVRDLAEKNYPKNLGSQALDTTVMFIPIEGAMSAALSVNRDLQTEAWKKRIVFASPNTLMAMLQVCERLWSRDKLLKQVDEIDKHAGLLIDSIGLFLAEFNEVGDGIKKAGDIFSSAKKYLNDSNQSVLARARRLVAAGAKGKRAIPETLQPDSSASAVDLPSVGDV